MRYPDQQLWWLICGLRQLGGIVEGTEWLLKRWPDLENWQHLPAIARGSGDAIIRTRDVAAELQKLVANPPIIEEIKKASWDTAGFAKSAPEVKEGLAQFYTEVVTEKIASRQPGAHEAYDKFLAMQSGPYLAHKEWLKEQHHQRSETIRFALLASRTKGIVKQDEWLASLAETNQKLRKPTLPDSKQSSF